MFLFGNNNDRHTAMCEDPGNYVNGSGGASGSRLRKTERGEKCNQTVGWPAHPGTRFPHVVNSNVQYGIPGIPY